MTSLHKFRRALVALALLVSMPLMLHSAGLSAQIYKWTDENGKVHFGDKPFDPESDKDAQEISVDEAYKPTQDVSSQEAALKQREAATLKSHDARRERDKRRAQEEQEQRRHYQARKQDLCIQIMRELKKFSDLQVEDGRATLYYLVHEDGTEYTSAEQDAYLKDLRERGAELGCFKEES